MVPILRPTKIRYYVNVMSSRGYKPRDVLSGSGIAESHLADPALLVDSRQCDIVVRNMLQLTRNPSLGLDIGGSVRLADFGVLAHAMMSSRTLGEAMNLAVRFYNLMGTRIQLGFEPYGNGGAMTVCDTLDARDPVRQFYVEEIVMLGNRLGEDLINAPYRLSGCTFAYPPPPHADLYAERLQCAVEFNAARNCFIKSASLLETPLRGSDPEFNEICLRQCTKLMRQSINELLISLSRRNYYFFNRF